MLSPPWNSTSHPQTKSLYPSVAIVTLCISMASNPPTPWSSQPSNSQLIKVWFTLTWGLQDVGIILTRLVDRSDNTFDYLPQAWLTYSTRPISGVKSPVLLPNFVTRVCRRGMASCSGRRCVFIPSLGQEENGVSLSPIQARRSVICLSWWNCTGCTGRIAGIVQAEATDGF